MARTVMKSTAGSSMARTPVAWCTVLRQQRPGHHAVLRVGAGASGVRLDEREGDIPGVVDPVAAAEPGGVAHCAPLCRFMVTNNEQLRTKGALFGSVRCS